MDARDQVKEGDKVSLLGEVVEVFAQDRFTGDQEVVVIEMGAGLNRYRLVVPTRFLKVIERANG